MTETRLSSLLSSATPASNTSTPEGGQDKSHESNDGDNIQAANSSLK